MANSGNGNIQDLIDSGDPSGSHNTLDQNELDELLLINGFLGDDRNGRNKSLIDEIKDAVLDSGKLSLSEWMALRDRLKQIESLIPHIDLIIQLKSDRKREARQQARAQAQAQPPAK